MTTLNESMPTDSPESQGMSPALVVLRTCFITVVFLVTVSGNILSIGVTHRTAELADSTRVLMTTLAVCDLTVGILHWSSIIASALDYWPFGKAYCDFHSLLITACFMMSISSILLINTERYVAVMWPYRFSAWCSKRRVIILVGIVSVVSTMSVFIAPILDKQATYFEVTAICTMEYTSKAYLEALFLCLGDVIPVFSMTVIYCKLIKISNQHAEKFTKNTPPQAPNGRPRRFHDNKALRTFLIVTLGFSACWTPSLVSRVIFAAREMAMPHLLEFVVHWLAACNSFFNVVIYCVFNRSFRQIAKGMIVKAFPFCKVSVAPRVMSSSQT